MRAAMIPSSQAILMETGGGTADGDGDLGWRSAGAAL